MKEKQIPTVLAKKGEFYLVKHPTNSSQNLIEKNDLVVTRGNNVFLALEEGAYVLQGLNHMMSIVFLWLQFD